MTLKTGLSVSVQVSVQVRGKEGKTAPRCDVVRGFFSFSFSLSWSLSVDVCVCMCPAVSIYVHLCLFSLRYLSLFLVLSYCRSLPLALRPFRLSRVIQCRLFEVSLLLCLLLSMYVLASFSLFVCLCLLYLCGSRYVVLVSLCVSFPPSI